MQRVPVDLVILVLAQDDIHVNPRQIRNWTLRGHITHTPDGYDLTEILTYLDRRAHHPSSLTQVNRGETLPHAELCRTAAPAPLIRPHRASPDLVRWGRRAPATWPAHTQQVQEVPMSDATVWTGRHPSVSHFEVLFRYDHLPAHLQEISGPCAALAEHMVGALPDGIELSAALRKLVEAKDCLVRQALIATTEHAHD